MERSGMRRQKIEYPYLRYLSVLLAVALLLTGVTFAGYRWEWNGLRSVGIGGFDCSYEIESVNSSVFTDRDYWVEYAGQWTDLGANDGRTVRFTLENNGGTAVQSTFRMYGPEEFWSNLALQLVREYPSGSDAVLTPQIVLADLIYEGEKEESGYRMKYGAYRAWGGTGSFFTGDSVDYGALGEGEAALSVTGGVDETGGALSAKWAGGSVSIENPSARSAMRWDSSGRRLRGIPLPCSIWISRRKTSPITPSASLCPPCCCSRANGRRTCSI